MRFSSRAVEDCIAHTVDWRTRARDAEARVEGLAAERDEWKAKAEGLAALLAAAMVEEAEATEDAS